MPNASKRATDWISETMQRYRATVGYDGTRYAGWQIQPGCTTVQGELQRVLGIMTESEVVVHGSGRTDQGVHARGQVIHFDLKRSRDIVRLRRGMNGLLEDDIRVRAVQPAAPRFHARILAVSKEYRYFIWNDEVLLPDVRLTHAHLKHHRLDVEAMNAAAQHLVGEHDFAAFTASSRRILETTVRRLDHLAVTRRGRVVQIRATGNGFLYRMMRSIAGHLIRVGEGTERAKDTLQVLKSGKRTARVKTAPAEGLFLWKVTY